MSVVLYDICHFASVAALLHAHTYVRIAGPLRRRVLGSFLFIIIYYESYFWAVYIITHLRSLFIPVCVCVGIILFFFFAPRPHTTQRRTIIYIRGTHRETDALSRARATNVAILSVCLYYAHTHMYIYIALIASDIIIIEMSTAAVAVAVATRGTENNRGTSIKEN